MSSCCKNFFRTQPTDCKPAIGYTPLGEENNHIIGHYKVYDYIVQSYPTEHRVTNLRTGKHKKVNAIELYNLLISNGISEEDIFETIPNVKLSLKQINLYKSEYNSL